MMAKDAKGSTPIHSALLHKCKDELIFKMIEYGGKALMIITLYLQ